VYGLLKTGLNVFARNKIVRPVKSKALSSIGFDMGLKPMIGVPIHALAMIALSSKVNCTFSAVMSNAVRSVVANSLAANAMTNLRRTPN